MTYSGCIFIAFIVCSPPFRLNFIISPNASSTLLAEQELEQSSPDTVFVITVVPPLDEDEELDDTLEERMPR